MKCEKCGEAMAVFHYRAIINGAITERHLCTDCAGEEGLASAMNWKPLLPDMFGFGGIFSFPPQGRRAMPMYGAADRFSGGLKIEEAAPEDSAARIPDDAGDEFRLKREITALRAQMQSAVNEEDFEKAAQLRDKIKQLENV